MKILYQHYCCELSMHGWYNKNYKEQTQNILLFLNLCASWILQMTESYSQQSREGVKNHLTCWQRVTWPIRLLKSIWHCLKNRLVKESIAVINSKKGATSYKCVFSILTTAHLSQRANSGFFSQEVVSRSKNFCFVRCWNTRHISSCAITKPAHNWKQTTKMVGQSIQSPTSPGFLLLRCWWQVKGNPTINMNRAESLKLLRCISQKAQSRPWALMSCAFSEVITKHDFLK